MRASGSWIWPTTPPSSVLSHHVWRSPLRYEDSVFPLLCMCVCLCVCVCLWLTNCMWHDISRASLSLHSLCVIYMQRVWQLCSQFVFGYLIAIIRLFCDGVLLPFFCACVCSLFYLVFFTPFFLNMVSVIIGVPCVSVREARARDSDRYELVCRCVAWGVCGARGGARPSWLPRLYVHWYVECFRLVLMFSVNV